MKIWVKPGGPDRRVPRDGAAFQAKRIYFAQDQATQTEDTDYIKRRLKDGDLVQVDDTGKPLQTATPAPQPAASAVAPAAAPKPDAPAAEALQPAIAGSAARSATDAASKKTEG